MKLKSETYNGHSITFEKNSRGIRAYTNELGENYYNTKKEALEDYKRTLDIFEFNSQKHLLKSIKSDMYTAYTKKQKNGKIIIFNVENHIMGRSKTEQEKNFLKSLIGKEFNSIKETHKYFDKQVEEYVYGK